MSSVLVTLTHTTTKDFQLDLNAEDIAKATCVDKYAQYCALPIVNTDDAIGWQIQEIQQKVYLNLSKMAFDYLSIPGVNSRHVS